MRVIYKSRLLETLDGCGSAPRWPTSDLGRYTCYPADGAIASRASMKPSSCCIEMQTEMGNSSVPATGREAAMTGCMLRHPGHRHWHFDAMASYSLRRAGSSQALVARNKVSFCLRDNLKVRGYQVVVPRRHFGKCSRNSQQGSLQVGWTSTKRTCPDNGCACRGMWTQTSSASTSRPTHWTG
jgi:hypothetical protein